MVLLRNIENINLEQLYDEIIESSLGSKFLHIKSFNHSTNNIDLEFSEDLSASEIVEVDSLIVSHIPVEAVEYEIELDVEGHISEKDIRTINYKTELNTFVSYTPEYTIHNEGSFSGLLDETCYYRGYVDESNKGVMVLCVKENYTIDSSDATLNNSGKPATERTKTWKYAKVGGGLDEKKTKVKTKKYNTRRKRHVEGIKRRDNILEQLVDNVGMSALLSGIFTSEGEAHEKLTALLQLHSSAFEGWKSSGRGTLYDDVLNDLTTDWLSSVISNATNQPEPFRTVIAPIEYTPVAHMMDMTMRSYIVEKLKGNIK